MSNVFNTPVITFMGTTYKIKEITIGALLDIETMKATLTNGFYGDILSHKTVLANWNLDNIDMFANLMVLAPDFVEKGLVAKSWRDMAPKDVSQLREEYQKNFVPWFNERMAFLSPPKVDDEVEKKSE